MKQVTIYTKLGCHLCDEAYRLLLGLTAEFPLHIDVVDITHEHNRELYDKYFLQIPVLSFFGTDQKLTWPFTAADVKACLNQLSED